MSHAKAAKSAHVIVLGNEKGGSGKSTTAMHLIIALLKEGHRVASIDTDSRQRTLTRYIENRIRRAKALNLQLEVPAHRVIDLGRGDFANEIESREFAAYVEFIDRVEHEVDFVVVDTPASNSYLMRLSHAMADTIVTPLNDSFLDIDVLGQIDQLSQRVAGISHYAKLVRSARIERLRLGEGGGTDWIIVRNRVSSLANRNQRHVISALKQFERHLDFRMAAGISERVIFRELFATGLTAFDPLDKRTQGSEPTMSHLAARREIRDLIDCLNLPARRSRPAISGTPAARLAKAMAAR